MAGVPSACGGVQHSVDRNHANRPPRPWGGGGNHKKRRNHLATWLICISLKAPCLVSLAGRSGKTSESDARQLPDWFIQRSGGGIAGFDVGNGAHQRLFTEVAALPNLLSQEPGPLPKAERHIPVSPARRDHGRCDDSGRKLAALSQDAKLNAALLMDANDMLRQERSRQPRFSRLIFYLTQLKNVFRNERRPGTLARFPRGSGAAVVLPRLRNSEAITSLKLACSEQPDFTSCLSVSLLARYRLS